MTLILKLVLFLSFTGNLSTALRDLLSPADKRSYFYLHHIFPRPFKRFHPSCPHCGRWNNRPINCTGSEESKSSFPFQIISLLIAVQASIAYTIFDAETPGISRPREWTLAIHWSIPILEKLLPADLFARLSETQCDPVHDRGVDETIELRNSNTGNLLKTISTPGMKRVSRKKLRSLCTEGIEVVWGKSLDGVTYDIDGQVVTAHFADESTYRGDILVGADGPKSKVRELLLGTERAVNSSVRIIYNMAIVKYGDAEKALHVRSGHPVNCLGYNPSGLFSFISSAYFIFELYLRNPKMKQSRIYQILSNQRLGPFRSVRHGLANETLASAMKSGREASKERLKE